MTGVTTRLRGRPWLSRIACNLVFMSPFVRPIRRPHPLLFDAHAYCCTVGLKIAHINRHGLIFAMIGRQSHHHLCDDALIAPTVVECFVRALGNGRIAPTQANAIDEDNPTQHATIINAWIAVELGKEGLKARHLHVAQPEKYQTYLPLVFEPLTTRQDGNQWDLTLGATNTKSSLLYCYSR